MSGSDSWEILLDINHYIRLRAHVRMNSQEYHAYHGPVCKKASSFI